MSDLRAIADQDPLGTFLDSALTLVDESKLHFEKNGFRITAVDPANVGSVQTMLGPKAFESYELDERDTYGVDLTRLDEALGFADSGDVVGVETKPKRYLELKTGSVSHDIATIDVDSIRAEPDMPNLELPAEIQLTGKQLDQAVRAADTVSDHITITVDGDEQVFRAFGKGDTDSTDVEYDVDELGDESVFADAESIFSIDYLKSMTQPIPADADVVARIGKEFPLELKWSHAEGYGRVTYLLAPRIDSD